MEKPFELAYTELKKGCFPEELSFRTTAEIKPLEGVIGQERAVKAFDFGLAVKMKGYRIPEALWHCASSRDRASSSRRTWQSWCSFSKQSCKRRSVQRIMKHRKTLWSILLMKREMRLWQK